MNDGPARTRTIGRLADISGVSVRTLHHYEAIGLLVPAGRTDAGYRQYSDADADRLTRILYYRELGFPLDAIAALLDDPRQDRYGLLERQHALLTERLARIQAMAASVKREMEAYMTGYNLTAEEKLEIFGDFDPAEHEDEVRERWGDTDAYRQSRERTEKYTKADWKAMQAEADGLNDRFTAALNAGSPATGDVAMALAEAHRQHIGRWYYECPYEMHRCLGAMYIDDPRFTANIDKTTPGLAAYMRNAIIANADRADGAEGAT